VNILLLGAHGQVGAALRPLLASLGTLTAWTRADLDLQQPAQICARVLEVRPQLIINAAAYTAVDRAESEPHIAHAINATAPAVLAAVASQCDALLVHYSTDYVFDGNKTTPYLEEDAAHPLNVYGQTKLEGERAIQSSGCRHLIFRTSWVYSATGHNFLRTILRLAKTQSRLRIVADQQGAPTAAPMIARLTLQAIQAVQADTQRAGLYHLSAAGQTTWHGFAQAIVQAAGFDVPVDTITTLDYPTPARRPMYSVLDHQRLRTQLDLRPTSWQLGLEEVMATLV
jgi:dTDP-4-dehydrorhamnose reductase